MAEMMLPITLLPREIDALCPDITQPMARVKHLRTQGFNRRQIQLHMAHRKQGTTDIYLDQHTTPVSAIDLRLPDNK